MRSVTTTGDGPPFAIAGGGERFSVALFGLFVYVFVIHSFKASLAPAAMIIGGAAALLQARKVVVPSPFLFMAGWIAWAAVTAVGSPYRWATVTPLTDYAKLCIVLFVTVNACRTVNQVIAMAGFWTLCFVLFPMRGTFHHFLTGSSIQGRYGWVETFGHPNDAAVFALLAIGSAGFLFHLFARRRTIQLALLGTIGALVVMIILTQSRGAIVGIAVAGGYFLARSKQRIKYAIVLAAFGAVTVLVAPQSAWERFGGMKYLRSTETLKEADSSAEQRYLIQQVALRIFLDSPATGVGIGAYPEAHQLYATSRSEWDFAQGKRDTHNMYLNVAAETGIPGVVLFGGMIVSAFGIAIRSEKRLRTTWPAAAEGLRILRFALVAVLVDAIFGTFHRSAQLFIYVGMLTSAAMVLPEFAGGAALGPAATAAPTLSRRRAAAAAPRRLARTPLPG